MLTPVGRKLLERWTYVLVRTAGGHEGNPVGDYTVPYSQEALAAFGAEEEYGDAFLPFLERFLAALSEGDWPAGSYYPGGWYRALVAAGEHPAQAVPTLSALEPFFLEELRVDAAGRWFLGAKPITGKVRSFFLHNLGFDTVLQRYRVRYPLEQHMEMRYLHHESPPLRVERVEEDGGAILLRLNNGRQETLRPETLRLGAAERLYCAVLPEQVPAEFEDVPRWQLLKDAAPDGTCWRLPAGGSTLLLDPAQPWDYADRLPS